MKNTKGAAAALFFICLNVPAQTNVVATAALRLTINYPPASVVKSMFGTLPKDVGLVEVTGCNDTAATLLLSSGRITQALRRNGIEAMSREAAIATMQTSESRNWKNILLRNSTHGMNIVNFLVISKAVSLGPVLSNALPSIQALLQAVIPEFAKEVPDHQYLNFDRGTLADKTQLTPLDCAAGLVFTTKTSPAAPFEVVLEVPSVKVSPADR